MQSSLEERYYNILSTVLRGAETPAEDSDGYVYFSSDDDRFVFCVQIPTTNSYKLLENVNGQDGPYDLWMVGVPGHLKRGYNPRNNRRTHVISQLLSLKYVLTQAPDRHPSAILVEAKDAEEFQEYAEVISGAGFSGQVMKGLVVSTSRRSDVRRQFASTMRPYLAKLIGEIGLMPVHKAAFVDPPCEDLSVSCDGSVSSDESELHDQSFLSQSIDDDPDTLAIMDKQRHGAREVQPEASNMKQQSYAVQCFLLAVLCAEVDVALVETFQAVAVTGVASIALIAASLCSACCSVLFRLSSGQSSLMPEYPTHNWMTASQLDPRLNNGKRAYMMHKDQLLNEPGSSIGTSKHAVRR